MILTGQVIKAPYTDKTIAEDPEQSKYIDVQVHPQGYVLRRVQLPRVCSSYRQPEVGSTILLFKQDDFSSKMIALLKDPPEFLTNNPLKGEGETGIFKPGEVQFESRGKAQLNLNNDGQAKLSDVSRAQQFVANPLTQTSYVQGMNVILSNRANAFITLSNDGSTLIQSVMDPQTMTEYARIKIDKEGEITIKSTKSNINIESLTGDVTIKSAKNVNIESTGNITIKGLSTKIGTLTKKLVTSTFLSLFNSHMHTSIPAGGPTTPPMVPMVDGVHTTTTTEAE